MRKYSLLLFFALTGALQLLAQPTISSFTPHSGPVGTSVVLSGSGFSTTAADNVVYFGAVRATVTAATATALTAIVPPSASYAPLTVTTDGLTTSSRVPFAVTFPEGGAISQNSFVYAAVADTVSPGNFDTRGLAVADLDGDGRTDVAVVDRTGNTVSVFRNTSTANTISLAPKADFPTGQNPIYVAAGDLDGDGRMELVVCNNNINDNTISVYRNTSTPGALSFATPQSFAGGTQPFAVAISDLDGDGKQDLAVANVETPGSVSILKNTTAGGTLSFAPRMGIAINGAFSEVAAADLDGDGATDLVFTNYFLNSLSVIRNTTTGGMLSFAVPQAFATGALPSGVAIGDLDGDGKVDMAVANFNAHTVSIFRNTSAPGMLSFTTRSDLAEMTSANDVSIADVDGDTKADLLVCYQFSTSSYGTAVLKNQSTPGAIGFLNSGKYSTLWTDRAAAADLNGDSKPDIVISGSVLRATLLKNQVGAPDIAWFSPSTAYTGTTVTIQGSRFTGITSVSFGGVPAASFTVVNAGVIKAVVGEGASGAVTVTNAYGNATAPGFIYTPPPVITSFRPAVAGTGTTVTITGTGFTGATSVSFGGTPAASFTVTSSTSITAVVGAGMSGDLSVTTPAGVSMVSGFTYVPPPVVRSFTPDNGGSGTEVTIAGEQFSGATAVSFGGTPALQFTVTSAGTITATVAGGSSGAVKVTTPYGTSSLAGFSYTAQPPPVITSVSSYRDSIGATIVIRGSHFNPTAANNLVQFGTVPAPILSATDTQITCTVPVGSLYAPLSVTNKATGLAATSAYSFNTTFRSGGPIQYRWQESFAAGGTGFPEDVCLGDLDGDGRLDIVLANGNSGDGSVSVLRQKGSGEGLLFDTTTLKVAFSASGIVIADFDGDGRPDIATCSYYPSVVNVLRNTGTAAGLSFAPAVAISTGYSPAWLATGDVDGDGRPDLVSANNFSGSVSILRNTGMPGVVSFADKADYAVGAGTTAVSLADLNGDGRPDLAATVANNNTVAVLRNTSTAGHIAFAARVDFPVGTAPASLCVGDMDGDGAPDIAVAHGGENSISVLRNTGVAGSIAFAPRITYTNAYIVPSMQREIVLNDLDSDGRPDLSVAHELNPGNVSVYRNTGSPGSLGFDFMERTFFLTTNQATALAIGDVDGDSKPDLVAPLYFGGHVAILRSQTAPLTTIVLCTRTDTVLVAREITGNAYRWEVDKGEGFEDLRNDRNHSYTATTTLHLYQVPPSFDGYLYRCVADRMSYSPVYKLAVSYVPVPVITASGPTTLCPGGSVVLRSSVPSGNRWYRDGLAIAGATLDSFTATQAGTYKVVVANECDTASALQAVGMAPTVTPTLSISAGSCQSNAVSFTATATNAGEGATIEWYVNDVLKASGTSFTLVNAHGAQVYARLKATIPCATNPIVTSSAITVNCTVTAVPDVDALESFTLAPNPTDGLLAVRLKLYKTKTVHFEVTDATGRSIYRSGATKWVGTHTREIDLRGAAPGLYFLKVWIGAGTVTEKLLIRR